MPEHEMWVSRPKLLPQDKIHVGKFLGAGWVLVIPMMPVDGERRFAFIACDSWEEAHKQAFIIRDLGYAP